MGSAGSVPADFDHEARGIAVMLIVLTTVAIISRLIARFVQQAKISTDDYLVVLGYFLNLGLLITILLVAHYGGVSLPKMSKMSKADGLSLKNTITSLAFLYTFSIIIIKISVLFMYRRIFTLNERWFRIAWWGNFLLIFPCYAVSSITLTAWQVSNSQKFGANNISKYGAYVLGATNAISDVLVLILPITMVWRLLLPAREKAAVIGIFMLGLVATSVSIMRVVRFRIKRDHHWNAAYAFYNDSMMSSTETSVALICICLTVVKPLLRKTRDLAASGAASLATLISQGSSGRRSNRSKASGSESIRNDFESIHSRRYNNAIANIQQYDLDTLPKKASDSQGEIAREHMHP